MHAYDDPKIRYAAVGQDYTKYNLENSLWMKRDDDLSF